MTKEVFLQEVAEALDTELTLDEDMRLEEIEEFDSIGVLSLMSLLDENGVKVSPADFEKLHTVGDLIALAQEAIDG
jgi:acyl carrier protein